MTSEPAKLSPLSPPASAGRVAARRVARVGALRERGWSASQVGVVVRAYVALMKPGIVWLLLVTTVPAMIMAADGWPGLDRIALTLLGGVLTAGGANALNQWYDRDIDALMVRTSKRPIPMGSVTPRQALLWGLLLVALGGLQLLITVNWLSAVWALAAVVFYVGVYTVWLKRWTTQNIVIGGAAGAVPPLVGWAAVSESVNVTALLLFLVVFFWTPPHFWALALRYKEDYARASVPMLPVVRGDRETKRQIFAYSVVLVVVSLLLPILGKAGDVYLVAALVLGAMFVVQAARVWSDRTAPMGLFFYSIAYLPALFLFAAIDTLVY